MFILGISAYYHDSAAVILKEGTILAAAEEERFTRVKHDKSFPIHSIRFCLDAAGISLEQVECVVFYDKPLLKFERIIESILWNVPFGVTFFVSFATEWLGKGKLFLRRTIQKELDPLLAEEKNKKLKIMFSDHHRSHAASAFFPSSFKDAGVLCVDGVGEWATTTCWRATGNRIEQIWHIDFPHSLGLLYSAFTYYLGFEVNDGEYKVMGLAPYGSPVYLDEIKKNLIDIKEDGTFRLDMEYFSFTRGLRMTNNKFENLFGQPRRNPLDSITDFHKNVASSIQKLLEEVLIKLAVTVKKTTNADNLCLAGGVALNCVANEKIKEKKIFKNIWVQPAAGDSGGALGAALTVWHEFYDRPRVTDEEDKMRGALLGPEFSSEKISQVLENLKASYKKLDDETLLDKVAEDLKEQKIVGWFQGRMEFGPRALGSRSILADPRGPHMQAELNQKIKFRESFRPFAPAVLEEYCENYFSLSEKSPYMLFTAPVKVQEGNHLPAITHIDKSARIQTVSSNTNPIFYKLIYKFKEKTNCAVLINTSFNIRGEPIVSHPEDAYRCFMNTDIDTLVLGSFYLEKKNQNSDLNWKYTTPELQQQNKVFGLKNRNLQMNQNLSEKELRKFGFLMSFLIPFLFIFVFPWMDKTTPQYWSLAPSILILMIALLRPAFLKKFHSLWMQFGLIMGWFKAKVFLTLIYFVLFVPYGILLRIFIKGQINDKFDSNKLTYAKNCDEPYKDSIQRLKFPV